MIEILLALLAGVVGGVLSRWIPSLPKKVPPPLIGFPAVTAGSRYEVMQGFECLYEGGDLAIAKAHRADNPGSILIADGVRRG